MTPLKDHEKHSLTADLRSLFHAISKKRKLQLAGLFVLQIVSALSEMASLGAVVPFLSALTNTSALMQNKYLAPVLKYANITEPNHLVMIMAVLFATTIVLANIFRFACLRYETYLSASIGSDLGHQLFKKILYQPYSYFLSNNSSKLVSKITSDLAGTLGAIQSILAITTQTLLALAIVVGLLIYNAPVAIVMSAITICAFTFIMMIVRKRLSHNSEIISDSYRNIIKTLQESFGGIRHIALGHTQDVFIRKFESADTPYRLKSSNNLLIRQAPRFFIESVGVMMISGLTIFFVVQRGNITSVVPLMGFLALACLRLLPATQQVYAALGALFAVKVPLNRTMDVLSQPINPMALIPTQPALHLQDSLKLENIYFRYQTAENETPAENWTLNNINLTIKAKSTVAFVGTTGSGKSTLADLILGLMTPQKGHITVDGMPLEGKNILAWQQGISHVPQHIFLMDCSIAENIAFGIKLEDIDMAKVEQAARHAKIDQFINTLPGKYTQTVGERGVRLSGGQLQRIGIARALYHNPSLILFDEATSALDNKTEQEVMASIEGLSREFTIILIAHRLSTVRKADTIFVFDHGNLVAQGSYNELLATSPHFNKMIMESEASQAA